MSPQRRRSKRGTGWKPPRDRREVVIAVLASLTVIVVTLALVWFLRPNRDSGSPTVATVATSTPSSDTATTTVPTTDTGSTDTTSPVTTSTP